MGAPYCGLVPGYRLFSTNTKQYLAYSNVVENENAIRMVTSLIFAWSYPIVALCQAIILINVPWPYT